MIIIMRAIFIQHCKNIHKRKFIEPGLCDVAGLLSVPRQAHSSALTTFGASAPARRGQLTYTHRARTNFTERPAHNQSDSANSAQRSDCLTACHPASCFYFTPACCCCQLPAQLIPHALLSPHPSSSRKRIYAQHSRNSTRQIPWRRHPNSLTHTHTHAHRQALSSHSLSDCKTLTTE